MGDSLGGSLWNPGVLPAMEGSPLELGGVPPESPCPGYVCLVDHALAEGEVGVGEVGESLEQDLRRHPRLEEGGVELVPAQTGEAR